MKVKRIGIYLFDIHQACENEEFCSEGDRAPKFGIYLQKGKTLIARGIATGAISLQEEKGDFAMKKHSFCLLIT